MKVATKIEEAVVGAQTVRRNLIGYLVVMSVLACLSLSLLALLLYAYLVKYPEHKFLATSDAQPVCAAISLTEPNISGARARDFAATATVGVYTYDYFNWRTQINKVLGEYFTPEARDEFRAELQHAGDVKNVVDRFQVVSAAVRSPPEIETEGVERGRYTWVVRLVVTVFYRTQVETLRENRAVTAKVVRVAVSPLNPNGVAIGEMISTTATINEAGK